MNAFVALLTLTMILIPTLSQGAIQEPAVMGPIEKNSDGSIRHVRNTAEAAQVCAAKGARLPTAGEFAAWAIQFGGAQKESFAANLKCGDQLKMTKAEFEAAIKSEEEQNKKDGFVSVYLHPGFLLVSLDKKSVNYYPRFYYDARNFRKPDEEIALGIDWGIYYTSSRRINTREYIYMFESTNRNQDAFSFGDSDEGLIRCSSQGQ